MQQLKTRMLGAGLMLAGLAASGQTTGGAKLECTILDYNGSGTRHWTVAWVTYGNGAFIKSLRKQGPSWTTTHWDSHCAVWNTARGGSATGSQFLDGYSSATATDYAGTNSPVILTWNCRDTNNNVVPDGVYKLWVQYAEDSGQGPYTTNGLSWVKGPAGAISNYPNMGANFASLRVTWTPTIAPTITNAPPATGTVGVPYQFTSKASGTTPITFSAAGLPTGLSISAAGLISGAPTTAGTFNGTITAANGTLPNATQPFSIVVSLVPVYITSVETYGTNLVLSGTGPANGICATVISDNVGRALAQWTPVATNTIGSDGNFRFTNGMSPGVSSRFYSLRVP